MSGAVRPAAGAALFVLLTACAAPDDGRHDVSHEVAFTTISSGKTFAIRVTVDFLVARNATEWPAVYAVPFTDQHGVVPPRLQVPRVDFTSTMVLGIAYPAHSDSCTGVTIVGVVESDRRLLVRYREFVPGKDAVCLQAFFAPYCFVTIARSSRPIEFEDVTDRSRPG